MLKPRIFIGSSSENIEIAEAIQTNLMYDFQPEIWDQSITVLSKSTLHNLMNAVRNFDFAIFILGGEDNANVRNESVTIARDNVIFELGLFMGSLGEDRVFIVKPHSVKLHLPTDLLGITYGEYDDIHSNKAAALRPFCSQVKKQVREKIYVDIPQNGEFGLNILANDKNVFESIGEEGLFKKRYGLYANTIDGQVLRVKIENKTIGNQEDNKWCFNKINMYPWEATQYKDGIQEFVLYQNARGKLWMWFVGDGVGTISIYLNNYLLDQRDIVWGSVRTYQQIANA